VKKLMLALVLCASNAHAFDPPPLQQQTTVNRGSQVLVGQAGSSGDDIFMWSGVFDGGEQRFRGVETIFDQPTVTPALIDCRPRGVRIPPAKVSKVERWSCLYRFANRATWEGPYEILTPGGLK